MLSLFTRKQPRHSRIDGPHPVPAAIDVARHRLRSRLAGRRRPLLGALVLVGLAAVAVNLTVTDTPPADTNQAATTAELADRSAAFGRADRAERSTPDPSEVGLTEVVPDGRPWATSPEPSPTPEPEPEPERPAEDDEPKPKDEPSSESKEESNQQAPKADWVHPMPGARTTSCYGSRWGTIHQGVDLAKPHGTPILAVGAGTVTHAGWDFGGYGISVVIDHQNGVFTHYAHASEAKVSVGQKVSAGQTIALEGSTGDSTGPHLHFEVHQGMWNQVEPTSWMRERGVTIGGC